MTSQQTILQQGYSSAFYDMPLHIVMRPTYHCNYNCSYCNQDASRPAHNDFLAWDKIKGIISRIASLNRSEYIFGFSGGEPTIYPHFQDMLGLLMDTIGEKLTNVYIITNGSRQGKLYDRIAEFSACIPFNITVSIHTDHAHQEHIDYLTQLLSEKCHLKYNLMFNPAKKEYVHAI